MLNLKHKTMLPHHRDLPPEVSIVTATYNRHLALEQTIRSVLDQEEQNWELIIVGDGCDERTGECIRRFDNPRIRYVNLPARFGEQAGPNSVGVEISRSPFIAFLNHDDIWFASHLRLALEQLRQGDCDLYISRAAFVHASRLRQAAEGDLSCFCASPLGRRLRDAYFIDPTVFEPSSCWVFSRELWRQVGHWNSARTLHRTPLVDWLLRAYRAGSRACMGASITCLKLANDAPASPNASIYDDAGEKSERLYQLKNVISETPEGRPQLDRDQRSPRIGVQTNTLTRLRTHLINTCFFWPTVPTFRAFGWDVATLLAACRGRKRGHILERLSKRRVGTPLPEPPDVREVVAALLYEQDRTL